jgi:hypothetical protein
MKKFISIYANWRNDVLFALLFIAAFLLLGDCTNMLIYILTKIIGAAIAYAIYRLYRYWNVKGDIPELNILCKEED